MGKTYCDLYYHATWATYERHPIITGEIERSLYPFLRNKAKRFGGFAHAVGGVEDHIHLVLRIPASMTVADFLGKLKGASSYFLNQEIKVTHDFRWQEGYGVSTVSFKKSSGSLGMCCSRRGITRTKTSLRTWNTRKGRMKKVAEEQECQKRILTMVNKPVP